MALAVSGLLETELFSISSAPFPSCSLPPREFQVFQNCSFLALFFLSYPEFLFYFLPVIIIVFLFFILFSLFPLKDSLGFVCSGLFPLLLAKLLSRAPSIFSGIHSVLHLYSCVLDDILSHFSFSWSLYSAPYSNSTPLNLTKIAENTLFSFLSSNYCLKYPCPRRTSHLSCCFCRIQYFLSPVSPRILCLPFPLRVISALGAGG